MSKRLTVTTLARQAGVSSKAIRYWESLGLLPRASRTHTGYRVFPPETEGYLRFIGKSKAIGLSLREMAEVLRLARTGHCPCEEVVQWTEARVREIENEIQSLSETLARLRRATREWRQATACPPEDCGEVCTLIEHLPEYQTTKGEKVDEQMAEVCSCNDTCCGSAGPAGAGTNGGDLLSEMPPLPALSVPLAGKQRAEAKALVGAGSKRGVRIPDAADLAPTGAPPSRAARRAFPRDRAEWCNRDGKRRGG